MTSLPTREGENHRRRKGVEEQRESRERLRGRKAGLLKFSPHVFVVPKLCAAGEVRKGGRQGETKGLRMD